MTAGNNGASKPEDDDPFGYLYEDGQAAGAQAPGQGGYGYPGPTAPGVPRTSYNQVRTVGERQYGQQMPQQQAYAQPNGAYAPAGTHPGGPPTVPVPPQGPGGRGQGGGSGRGGPNTKGLLIGAVAVVVIVVVAIVIAVRTSGGSDDRKNEGADASPTPSATETRQSPEPEQSGGMDKPVELPKQDAATLKLGGSAALDNTVKGAKSANGQYISLNQVGRSATWSLEVPKAGAYTLFVTYGVPGKDAKTSLTINDGEPRSINMKNFALAKEGDLEKGWTTTFAWIDLDKGANTIQLSCREGDQCDANLDQLSLKSGHVKR
ncbi:carbohydrate-binding protein [Streptomyces sp. DT24]|uniref:carbohydrate-binding protein n=1 Tax=Streptomyces sp. DT24 TaxID=3416520 RepID=UPI003CE71F29